MISGARPASPRALSAASLLCPGLFLATEHPIPFRCDGITLAFASSDAYSLRYVSATRMARARLINGEIGEHIAEPGDVAEEENGPPFLVASRQLLDQAVAWHGHISLHRS